MLIFNLHHVEPEIRHPSRRHISITPQGLRRMIRLLRWIGFEIVSLREAMADFASGDRDNSRKVLLTFDDGYENNYRYAAPVLEEERCPATIFVLPGRFSGSNAWDQGELPESERDRLMSPEQMKTLAQSSYITFGSHGLLHQRFPSLGETALRLEIEESYAILNRELGAAFLPVLAYPWGDYSEAVVQAMENSPYQLAFTVDKAPWSAGTHRFKIPRYSIYYRDGNPLILLAKLLRNGLLPLKTP